MKNYKAIFVLFFVCFFGLQLALAPVSAATEGGLWGIQSGLGDTDKKVGKVFEQDPNKPREVQIIVATVIKIFLGVIGIIFLIMIILAGYKWMTASGNEEKVKEAQSQLARALIGLVIILMSWAITIFVTGCIGDASGVGGVWNCQY